MLDHLDRILALPRYDVMDLLAFAGLVGLGCYLLGVYLTHAPTVIIYRKVSRPAPIPETDWDADASAELWQKGA